MLVVSKFGGSSVANSTQFKKVKNIIESNPYRNVVIVSALGKKEKGDSKITDLLYLLHAHLKYNVPYDNIFDLIKTRFTNVRDDLGISFDLDKEFEELKKMLHKDISEDFLVSRGEYITAKLMAIYLGFSFVDSKDLIKFNYDGKVNYDKSYELIKNAYENETHLVIPGFYGSYLNGEIKTFSRGGSDISGAIISSALNADYYENWTDVSGILMADPKIIDNAKIIKEISYEELRELSYMGANVLHEETVFPVQKNNIPIRILNTNRPNDEGTIITDNCADKSQLITGISGKKHFTSFTITKSTTSSKLKTLLDVLKVFDLFKVNIEHIPTGIDTFSCVVESKDIEKIKYDLLTEIKKLDNVSDISIDEDIALIAVVGRNMVDKPGISGKIFGIVGNNNINIKMIAQGSQELTIIVGVSNKDFENTIKALYNNLTK